MRLLLRSTHQQGMNTPAATIQERCSRACQHCSNKGTQINKGFKTRAVTIPTTTSRKRPGGGGGGGGSSIRPPSSCLDCLPSLTSSRHVCWGTTPSLPTQMISHPPLPHRGSGVQTYKTVPTPLWTLTSTHTHPHTQTHTNSPPPKTHTAYANDFVRSHADAASRQPSFYPCILARCFLYASIACML